MDRSTGPKRKIHICDYIGLGGGGGALELGLSLFVNLTTYHIQFPNNLMALENEMFLDRYSSLIPIVCFQNSDFT